MSRHQAKRYPFSAASTHGPVPARTGFAARAAADDLRRAAAAQHQVRAAQAHAHANPVRAARRRHHRRWAQPCAQLILGVLSSARFYADCSARQAQIRAVPEAPG